MISKGKFIFKSISKKDGGKFVNQNGQEIEYKPKYVVKFDEVTENDSYERKTNVSMDDDILVKKLMQVQPYTEVVFQFEVGFNQSGITAKLTDVGIPKE